METVTALQRHSSRKCAIRSNARIEMTHIGDDYISVKVGGEEYDIDGFAQHIIWELLRRLENKEVTT